MQVVILAAGLGSRMGALTQYSSKAMLPLPGRLLIEELLHRLTQAGIREVVLICRPYDHALRALAANPSIAPPDTLTVLQEAPLGTAHALQQAAPYLRERFLVAACDNLLSVADLRALVCRWEAEEEAEGILAVLKARSRDEISRSGLVRLEGARVVDIQEKPDLVPDPPQWISLPLYAFRSTVINHLQNVQRSVRAEYELQDAIQAMIQVGGVVRALAVSGRVELTYPSDLYRMIMAELNVSAGATRWGGAGIPERVKITHPVFIEVGASLGAGCEIGPNVYLAHGSSVCTGACVRESIVLGGGCVGENEVVERQIIAHSRRYRQP